MYIIPSNRKNKKWQVNVNGKVIHFGDTRYEDYTIHKDPERRKQYIIRHRNDNITDPSTAGFWSYHLLWSHPNMTTAFNYIMKTFKPNLIPYQKK